MDNKQNNDEGVKYVTIILLFAVGLIFIMPYLLTRPTIFGIEFNNSTGVIGDTIGGITTPIVGLLGAYLVFLGFKIQIRTNKEQFKALREQRDDSIKSSNYSQIKDLIDLSYYTLNKIKIEIGDKKYVGKEIFNSFIQTNRKYTIQKFLEHIDMDLYMTFTLDFSHQAVLVSRYYSKSDSFKLTELGKEIITEELNNMVHVMSDIITCTKELGKYNSSYVPIIGTLEKNIDRIVRRLPAAHERIELD